MFYILIRLEIIKRLPPQGYCMEWKQSRCFNVDCKIGQHPKIRADLDLEGPDMVFFRISASRKLDEAVCWASLTEKEKQDKRDAKEVPFHFALNIRCHRLTPFSVIMNYVYNRFVSILVASVTRLLYFLFCRNDSKRSRMNWFILK